MFLFLESSKPLCNLAFLWGCLTQTSMRTIKKMTECSNKIVQPRQSEQLCIPSLDSHGLPGDLGWFYCLPSSGNKAQMGISMVQIFQSLTKIAVLA